jgi:putative acetyltransferase
MNEVLIRRAVPSDALPIIEIHTRSIRALCRDDYREEQLAAWIGNCQPEAMKSRLDTRPFFVAELAGKQIGYAAYNPASRELLSVFVDPDHARQGVASMLLHKLLDDARSNGLTALWLDSSRTAVPFYENFGFEGVLETTHTFDGVPLACLRMELSLTG